MIFPSESLRQLLLDIDRSKFRVWALTNAYRTVRRGPPGYDRSLIGALARRKSPEDS